MTIATSDSSFHNNLHCNNSFVNNDNCINSNKIDNKFECDNCGRRYKYSRSVWLHKKMECGKEPGYQCYICYKKFHRPGNLKSHIIMVHNILPDINKNKIN